VKKTYEIDYGTWESGCVLVVEAYDLNDALLKANKLASDRSLSGSAVQAFIRKGDQKILVWDYCSAVPLR
jgi:hypothetical protein